MLDLNSTFFFFYVRKIYIQEATLCMKSTKQTKNTERKKTKQKINYKGEESLGNRGKNY